jgi:hypothetical protein
MFDNIINLNNYLKPRIIEDFSSISDRTTINKNFDNNQKINRSMLVDSVTKLVNNVSSDVIQNNSSTAASAAGASNSLWLSGVQCDDVTITSISQGAESTNQTLVKSSQTNTSKISNDISTNIDKTIEKIGSTDLDKLQAENTKQLNDFMNAMPGYDRNKAQKLASRCLRGGSLISAGNSCNVSTSYELDASVRQALELDESFKINDTDNIANDIKTKLNQANFASCQANASASNQIVLQNITCASMNAASKTVQLANAEASGTQLSQHKRGKLEISDIEQQAVTKLYMTCVFDQKNTSEIANKIVNNISKKYNQIYDAVEQKGKDKGKAWMDEKMNLVDVFTAAGVEKIIAAAGNLPPLDGNNITKTPETDLLSSNTGDILPTNGPGIDNTVPTRDNSKETSGPTPNDKKSQVKPEQTIVTPDIFNNIFKIASEEQSLLKNPWFVYGGIGLFVLIIFIIIIIVIVKSKK